MYGWFNRFHMQYISRMSKLSIKFVGLWIFLRNHQLIWKSVWSLKNHWIFELNKEWIKKKLVFRWLQDMPLCDWWKKYANWWIFTQKKFQKYLWCINRKEKVLFNVNSEKENSFFWVKQNRFLTKISFKNLILMFHDPHYCQHETRRESFFLSGEARVSLFKIFIPIFLTF